MYRILVADDEPNVLSLLKDYFEINGYEVITAGNGKTVLDRIKKNPDIILLDINMPDMDGISVCREIRSYVSCPILFLTAKVEDCDKIMGFSAGGDDYIVKPFSIDELGARVMAHIRREHRGNTISNVRFFGKVSIDYSAKTISVNGMKIEFTKKGFEIIELLSINTEQVFDKERIYEKLWGYDAEGNSGQLTENKTAEIISRMGSQIEHLESYTYKMSALQKLEDILPDIAEIQADVLKESLSESGKYICRNKQFSLDFYSNTDILFIDSTLVMEVYENIISNAERYADDYVRVYIFVEEDFLKIVVYDDGKGFSDKALKLAKEPFYRDDKEQNSSHFGLGLYICRIICEKCGGNVDISNTEDGGKVTANFFCGSR